MIRILAAGMHRSGSTWLFNTLRMIFTSSGRTVYSCFFSEYDHQAAKGATVHIAKTHQFDGVLSDRIEGKRIHYDYIFTTCRDLRDLAASTVRAGIVPNRRKHIVQYLENTVIREYQDWAPYSDMEIRYEEMMQNKEAQIALISEKLGISISAPNVNRLVEGLPFPKEGEQHFSDSQLHFNHITNGVPGTFTQTLSRRNVAKIEVRFADWLIAHDYRIPKRGRSFWR
jgi:hypothetical protein